MSSGRSFIAACVVASACAVAACGSSSSNGASRTPNEPPRQESSAPAPAPIAPAAAAPAPVEQFATADADDATGNLIDHPARITDADIPPLPIVGFAPPRPMEVVRAVFVFAAKHPEVLSHIPCFCGCQGMGHRNNDDCFVKRRDARERPIAWEPHGMG